MKIRCKTNIGKKNPGKLWRDFLNVLVVCVCKYFTSSIYGQFWVLSGWKRPDVVNPLHWFLCAHYVRIIPPNPETRASRVLFNGFLTFIWRVIQVVKTSPSSLSMLIIRSPHLSNHGIIWLPFVQFSHSMSDRRLGTSNPLYRTHGGWSTLILTIEPCGDTFH